MDLLPDCVVKRIFMYVVPYDQWFTELRFVCKKWNLLIRHICQTQIYGLEFWGFKGYVVQMKRISYENLPIFLTLDFPILIKKFDTFFNLAKTCGPYLRSMYIVVSLHESDIKNCKMLLKCISMFNINLTCLTFEGYLVSFIFNENDFKFLIDLSLVW